MVYPPVLTGLRVIDYRLFPGEPRGSGITWSFEPGVSLIAGINGLGKTTLLMMILRLFTGPYDLTGDGMPQSLDVVLPKRPVPLRPPGRRFFAERVADGAEKAEAMLSATIGGTEVSISRSLKNLALISFDLDRERVTLPSGMTEREELLQYRLSELMGLGSFVDVLLILHHMILFLENRPGALWDPNAQRQLLRALCMDGKDAWRVVELERSLQSADSQARNIHARMNATKRDLTRARQREAGSKGVLAQLEAEQKLLDAELKEANRLEAILVQLDTDRKNARLAHERAKIEREAAAGAVERLKYTALLQYFPDMDDTTRLVMSRIMTESRCLVCDADATEKRIELEQHLKHGRCPVCGAEPKVQDRVVASHQFEQAKLDQAGAFAERATREEETTDRELRDLAVKYEETLDHLSRVQQSIRERKRKDRRLRFELPQTVTSMEYESTLKAMDDQFRQWAVTRATGLRDLRTLLGDNEAAVVAKSKELIDTFSELTRALLVEDVRLVQVRAEPRYLQAPGHRSDRLLVPAYVAEMTAADRPGFVKRDNPKEVSESQRELVDLAFRLALLKVFAATSTFAMETPEASLDSLAMERVGRALAEFAAVDSNRLVVTSNLTNVGIVTALFGGPTPKGKQEDRVARVLNLLRIAAPNGALLHDRARYQALLEDAIYGAAK